ncbi:MAG TPA: hemerythrin domain-containing protein [Lacipirellulaceae bacterium]|nr:hemerythrin domain-containing protein [Lacipirellulaceae bacterium]
MYATHPPNAQEAARASQMEHQILDHVKQALRITLDWKAPSVSMPRKMSSVQFTMKSFSRHLLRMMDLEERDGYLSVVLDEKPNLDSRIRRLQMDHRYFRQRLEEMTPDVAALPAMAEDDFEFVCAQIAELLDRVDQHDAEEIELLQDTLLCDEGGEG